MIFVLLFLATCFLAYSNGANDNFKGVASLFGSGTCSYRTAISWATITTFAGSITSIFLAQTLLKKFSGKGIVPDQFVGSEYFRSRRRTRRGSHGHPRDADRFPDFDHACADRCDRRLRTGRGRVRQ